MRAHLGRRGSYGVEGQNQFNFHRWLCLSLSFQAPSFRRKSESSGIKFDENFNVVTRGSLVTHSTKTAVTALLKQVFASIT